MSDKVVKKAVISAAGKGTRQYPATNAIQKELFPLVDRNGITKPTIQIIVEEALQAGIEQIALVIQPEVENQFRTHFKGLNSAEKSAFENKTWGIQQSEILENISNKITYIHQIRQEGYGHAIYCAREWVGNEPFLLMLGDHVYISHTEQCCASQVIEGFSRFGKSIFAVRQTPSESLHLFGTVKGNKIQAQPPAYKITHVYEKPSIQYAKKNLTVPDLPPDTFLCFFGMHVMTPALFSILEEHVQNNIREKGEIQLTTAQAELCKREGAIGLEVQGVRMDMGTPRGYVETQILLSLNSIHAVHFKNYCRQVLHEN